MGEVQMHAIFQGNGNTRHCKLAFFKGLANGFSIKLIFSEILCIASI